MGHFWPQVLSCQRVLRQPIKLGWELSSTRNGLTPCRCLGLPSLFHVLASLMLVLAQIDDKVIPHVLGLNPGEELLVLIKEVFGADWPIQIVGCSEDTEKNPGP